MVLDEHAATQHLALRAVEEPRVGATELLVRAEASGVNRADLLQRRGGYKQPALARDLDYTIAGMEIAGEVVAIGSEASGYSPGDRVMAMCGGSYADLVAVDARLALRRPDRLDWWQAAALPVAAMTAYDALARCGTLAPGESVLITGASSAVGLITLQVARVLGASTVIATTRSQDKAAVLRDAGADVVIVGEDVTAQVRDATDGRGADVVIDHVGGPVFGPVLLSMARGGRYVSVGRLGGQQAALDLNLLARERLTLVGATFRTRTIEQYAEIARELRERVLPAIETGEVRAIVADTFDLTEANEALDTLGSRPRSGKVVLRIGSTA